VKESVGHQRRGAAAPEHGKVADVQYLDQQALQSTQQPASRQWQHQQLTVGIYVEGD
jgi:hypothetical protein